jgi:hypothetical protein
MFVPVYGMMTDFTRVLLTDKVAWGFFGLADREHLLYTSHAGDNTPAPQRGAINQRTLSLLVLFDKIIVHDFSDSAFRIPDLENDGIVQVIARETPANPVEPLPTRWKKGPLRSRKKPPASLLRSLRLLKEESSLVIDRLLSVRSDWETSLATALHVSRRGFLTAFFDYALACVEGNTAVLRESILNRLPDDMLAYWTRRLFDFQVKDELMDEVTAKMVFAIAFADEVRIIQELSEQLGVGVATEHYRSKYISRPSALDPRSIADHFVVLRTALAEDRGALPRIRDIRHALALRQDPHLRSLRELLVEFHKSVQHGDATVVANARREVTRAKRAMTRRLHWQRGLDWVTYLALPVGIAEALTGAPPITGTSLSVLGATGTAITSRTKRRHSWVLFNL